MSLDTAEPMTAGQKLLRYREVLAEFHFVKTDEIIDSSGQIELYSAPAPCTWEFEIDLETMKWYGHNVFGSKQPWAGSEPCSLRWTLLHHVPR